MRILWFLIPAIVVATMLPGRTAAVCPPDATQVCLQRPATAQAPAMCCIVARACAQQCAQHGEDEPPSAPCTPTPDCRLCCSLCEPRLLAPLPLQLVITGITLWPNLDPSYPILTDRDATHALARYFVPPRPPDDANARRAILCCWLT